MPRSAALVTVLLLALAEPVGYRPPVEAPVSDPFRAPPSPFAAGNRGLEYDTAAGTPVRAAAGGTVTFAGPVAGHHWVTVRHADGLRTTYGPLGRVGVRRGATIGAGAVVGTAGDLLLWTARLGDAYLDPASLLEASGSERVRLVPDSRLRPR